MTKDEKIMKIMLVYINNGEVPSKDEIKESLSLVRKFEQFKKAIKITEKIDKELNDDIDNKGGDDLVKELNKWFWGEKPNFIEFDDYLIFPKTR